MKSTSRYTTHVRHTKVGNSIYLSLTVTLPLFVRPPLAPSTPFVIRREQGKQTERRACLGNVNQPHLSRKSHKCLTIAKGSLKTNLETCFYCEGEKMERKIGWMLSSASLHSAKGPYGRPFLIYTLCML